MANGKPRIKKLATLYRQAQKSSDSNLLRIAESAMLEAMAAEAAIAKMAVAEALVAEALVAEAVRVK